MAIATMITLFGIGCYLAILGYHNYRLYQASLGASEHEVHLERQGSFSVLANPPGRSMFRPGGVLRIFLSGPESEGFVSHIGKGTLRVVDRSGRVALEEELDELAEGHSSWRGRFIGPLREFDTSAGGPYEIRFEILEPFTSLARRKQIMSVHHFVSGSEAVLHIGQFAFSGLLLGTFCFIGYRFRAANKRTGANAGGRRQLPMRTRWAARVAQFCRSRSKRNRNHRLR